ncbi:MAG: hypothetical protein AB1505_11205 [Candidatus Latescibacterota bacterium]
MRTAMRTLAGVLAVQVCLAAGAQAQLVRAWSEKDSGTGYLLFGAARLDVASLNAALERSAYQQVIRSPLNDMEDSAISFGLGSHGVVHGVVIGWELQWLSLRETTNPTGTHRAALRGGCGQLNVGFLTYSAEGLDIYPMLGIGASRLDLTITQRSALAFGQVLQDPDRAVHLRTGGFLLSPSLGADYLLPLARSSERLSGVVVGLRLGYGLAPMQGGWELDGSDVVGGPQASLSGPYVRLLAGVGSRRNE